MTADIGRVVFYLGLILASLTSYECRSELQDGVGESKSTKPVVQLENSSSEQTEIKVNAAADLSVVGSRSDSQVPIIVPDLTTQGNRPDDGVLRTSKKPSNKKNDKKSETEETTKLEKPIVLKSRGAIRHQQNNTDHVRATGLENGFESGNVDDVLKLPLPKLNESIVLNFDPTSTDKHENSTRSAKSSFHYQGGDGYTFENQFTFDADKDDVKFDDRISTYPINDPGNNIDKVRNFNENSGNVKLKNIVRKPQGFSLTTESSAEADILRKTVTRFNGPTTKRKPTESPVYVPKTEIATDPSSTAVNRNEISRKPSMKPSTSYTRRRGSPTTAVNDNSLPTTSTAWALASLKTPATVKLHKRPVPELKKNLAEVLPQAPQKPMFVTTIKPFRSWSTKLLKTTTDSATDIPTTMKPFVEIDAETFAPMGFFEPKLMNMSITSSPKPTTEGAAEEKNETMDIQIDLVEDSKSPIVVANSSHNIVTDSMRYNYMVGNSSSEKNDTFITLNVHQMEEPMKHVSANEIDKSSKNEIESVSKSPLPKFGIVLKDEPPKEPSSTTESLDDKNSDLLNDVKSPSESNDFRNTTSSSEAPRIDYQNTESNTIFDQMYKDEKKNVPVKRVLPVNTTESNAVREIVGIDVTKSFDLIDKLDKQNNTSVDSRHDSKEVVTDASPMYDIEIDDDNTTPTVATNETVIVDIKDWSSPKPATSTTTSTTSTTTTTTTATTTTTTEAPMTEIPSSTIPTLKLTTRTESLDDITTSTTRRTTPKRVYSTPSLITARPSTTMEIITMTYPSMDDFTTFNPIRTTEWNIFTKKKNTKLSPAPPRATDKPVEVTTISTSSTVRTTEETRRRPYRPTTTTEEVTEPLTTSTSKPIVISSSTEQIEVYTISNDHSSSSEAELPSSSEKSAEVTVIIETTLHPDDLPMAPTFRPKLSPENVPGYLMLIFKSSFAHICRTKAALKENLFQYITERSSRVQSKDQVVMVVDPEQCKEPDDSPRLIPVALYVVDDLGSYDKTLIDEMQAVLDVDNLNNYTIPIHKIVYQANFVPDNSRVIAAMIITCIAAVCFVVLIFLMCTIRNRQKLSYGQRCTPVSPDDYNLDNISDYNSIRRKGAMRASKRSYGNPAFDDPMGPSKTLTYNGLIKACENRCALDEEFSQIPVITVKPEELPPGAELKNRYANVIPLPETRVSLLPNNCTDSIHDYINANYVKGFKGADKFFIACQAPLQNTIEDFWKMIWKEQTKVVIMLTGLTENGVEKCADYLPPSEVLDCHRLFGDYQVTLKKREVKEKYVISSLQLKNLENNLWREVTHLWYTSWPAQGVPSEQSSIIALLIEARAYMRNKTGPHVVHCSPGTGRTGTVIAIDICIRDYELTRSVNIPLTVAKLRRCRAGAVQTKEQYAFIYKVLTLYAKKLNGGTPLESL